jgi:hypothetical protein
MLAPELGADMRRRRGGCLARRGARAGSDAGGWIPRQRVAPNDPSRGGERNRSFDLCSRALDRNGPSDRPHLWSPVAIPIVGGSVFEAPPLFWPPPAEVSTFFTDIRPR